MNSRIRTLPLANSCLHHDHAYHQFVIAMTGRAEFEIAGKGGQIDASHGCLVPGGEVHFYEGIGENNHVVVDLPAEHVDPKLVRLFDDPRYFEADSNLRLLLSYIQREAPIWQIYPEATEGMAQSLLAALHHRTFSTGPTPNQLSKLDLAALDTFIQKHLPEPLPVSRLAGAVHRSVGHFHVLFRDATGVTPYRYVCAMRLSRARELLLETSLPLTEVASQVGFSSQSALTHAFRRQYGEPPGRLRRLH
ncbi:AraC family transcriptional regulator [Marinobacter sp.]|uniref:AraC family transcriptional regulator n=2 Tax=Marinobacter sp. TaxID=50741 RepID=UPI000C59F9CF|nr:AraC family transcriptional regulator [Marinobacter sp.]MBE94730.1 AraC family transcriptional regulator [Marinobacter sp.]MBP55231.1 AraC family transcriptional regulator [Marinobacter sp.]